MSESSDDLKCMYKFILSELKRLLEEKKPLLVDLEPFMDDKSKAEIFNWDERVSCYVGTFAIPMSKLEELVTFLISYSKSDSVSQLPLERKSESSDE